MFERVLETISAELGGLSFCLNFPAALDVLDHHEHPYS